jgi:hypothetical protein
MNSEDRKKLLAESLRNAARKAEQERIDNETAARLTKAVQAELSRLLAETSKSLSCPSCGATLPESYKTDPSTSATDDDDEDDDTDYEDRKLAPLQRALKDKGIDPFAED